MDTTTSIQRPPSPTLQRLLDEDLAFSPSVQVVYSSHLAMALAALDQMGAAPEVLEATMQRHARSEAEPRDDTDLLDVVRDEVARNGIDATVRRRAGALVDAPGTALFHPMIRLAYGLDAGHEGQVAAALLDWERRREVLPVPRANPGTRTMSDVAAALAAFPAGTWPDTFDLAGTARRREFAEAVDGLDLERLTTDDLAEFALHAHVAADAFVTLHLVTGARAVHRIAPLLDAEAQRRLIAETALTMLVAYAVVGAPPLPADAGLQALRRLTLPSVEPVAAAAVADKDPHVIKLANVALVEEERTGDPLYRYLAARVVGLVPADPASN